MDGSGAERYRRNRDLARLDPCIAWLEVEQRDIEGIEAWLGLTLAQPGLKRNREI
jgi:hypothetical protein